MPGETSVKTCRPPRSHPAAVRPAGLPAMPVPMMPLMLVTSAAPAAPAGGR